METIIILLFVIPAIIAVITTFAEIKKPKETVDGKTLKPYQRITIFGFLIIILSITAFVLGLKHLNDTNIKGKEHEAKIDSLTSNMTYVKAKSDSYYDFLKVLGYTIDSASKEGKKQIDSLITVTKNQKILLDSTQATLEFCATDSNMVMKEISPRFFRMPIEFCSGNATLHDILVRHYYVKANNGFSFVEKIDNNLLNLDRMQRNDHLKGETFLNRGVDTDSIFLLYKFSFTDDKKRKYAYNDLYLKPPYKKTFSILNKQYTTDVVNYLKANKLW